MAFQTHAAIWFLVNLFLLGIWAVTGAGYFWPIWTIMPWGFALALQGWATYGLRRS